MLQTALQKHAGGFGEPAAGDRDEHLRVGRIVGTRGIITVVGAPTPAGVALFAMAFVRGAVGGGKARFAVAPVGVVCGSYAELTAYIADPARWREVVGVCRDPSRRRNRAPHHPPPVDPAVVWQTERERALAAHRRHAALPESQKAALRAVAARGPGRDGDRSRSTVLHDSPGAGGYGLARPLAVRSFRHESSLAGQRLQ
jgi:hypothetical protein